MTAVSGSRDQDAGSSGAPAAPGSGMRWRQVFPGQASQLHVLRRWLESLLPACPARDGVASVATELAANAITHTASGRGGCFAVEITWHQPVVRVAVTDCGSPGWPRLVDDPDGEQGRGLQVVKGLSVRAGVCGDHQGHLVSSIYMIPLKDMNSQKGFTGLKIAPVPADHVDIVFNAGHPGVPEPHYHITVWYVSAQRAAELAK